MSDPAGGVLIVGAGPRLGAAIARQLAGGDRPVGLISRSERAAAAVADALRSEGRQAFATAADAADPDDLGGAITTLAERAGGFFGVAVHNVSVWRDAGVLQLRQDDLFADLAAGAASLLTIARAVVPAMIARGGGTVLTTGSVAADAPAPGAPSLGVQKAALRTLTVAMAGELAAQGVHCATVTIHGVLGTSGFDPDRIATIYGELDRETRGPREAWRTVVDYRG
jgi:short-subunit dehydrogenase